MKQQVANDLEDADWKKEKVKHMIHPISFLQVFRLTLLMPSLGQFEISKQEHFWAFSHLHILHTTELREEPG